jgi:hypothetical protein
MDVRLQVETDDGWIGGFETLKTARWPISVFNWVRKLPNGTPSGRIKGWHFLVFSACKSRNKHQTLPRKIGCSNPCRLAPSPPYKIYGLSAVRASSLVQSELREH